jgi:5-methylcytosine-specific restriction endonuclease McrA
MGIPINKVQDILRLEAGFEIKEVKNKEVIEVNGDTSANESIPILVKTIIKGSKKKKLPEKEVYKRVKPLLKRLSEEELKRRAEISLNKQLKKQAPVEKIHKRIVHLERDMVLSRISKPTSGRNPYVAELAKRKAKGICQLCKNPAPFNDKDGKPYLETHHIVWISEGGEDTIENCTALCPNCHKKMHILNLKSDIAKLLANTTAKMSNS